MRSRSTRGPGIKKPLPIPTAPIRRLRHDDPPTIPGIRLARNLQNPIHVRAVALVLLFRFLQLALHGLHPAARAEQVEGRQGEEGECEEDADGDAGFGAGREATRG
jgi:hypothetical protein